MKLATLKSKHSRDGQLYVVSSDLKHCVSAHEIAPNLQNALDRWEQCESELKKLSENLNLGKLTEVRSFEECLEQGLVAAPLPRAYQWADGSAYVNHVELVRKARGADMPQSFYEDPLMYQGGSDTLLGPRDDIECVSEEWGIDLEAEVTVVTGDVPMSCSPQQALSQVKLLMLVNDVSLRNLTPGELAKGFGFFQSKPSSAFSSVAVTPDELGESWHSGKVHLPLHSKINGKFFGCPDAGVDMTFDFGRLMSHAAKTRHLCAGSIIGSGTVSNKDRSKGSSCLAEKRALEMIEFGKPQTSFLSFGDRVQIEMFDLQGQSVFGAIDQKVIKYQ